MFKDSCFFYSCFLDWEPSLGAFYGPVAFLLLLNMVFYLRLLCILAAPPPRRYSSETETNDVTDIDYSPGNPVLEPLPHQLATAESMESVIDDEHRPIVQLQASFFVTLLFCLAWASAAFAIGKPFVENVPNMEVIFSYVYGGIVVVLGIFILVFYGFGRSDMRKGWKMCCSEDKAVQTVYTVNANNPAAQPMLNGHAQPIRATSSLASGMSDKSSTHTHHTSNSHQIKISGVRKPPSNMNLVPSYNATLTDNSSYHEPIQIYYNPRQNGIAKKYWERSKRHHQLQRLQAQHRPRDDTSDLNSFLDGYRSGGMEQQASQYYTSDMLTMGSDTNELHQQNACAYNPGRSIPNFSSLAAGGELVDLGFVDRPPPGRYSNPALDCIPCDPDYNVKTEKRSSTLPRSQKQNLQMYSVCDTSLSQENSLTSSPSNGQVRGPGNGSNAAQQNSIRNEGVGAPAPTETLADAESRLSDKSAIVPNGHSHSSEEHSEAENNNVKSNEIRPKSSGSESLSQHSRVKDSDNSQTSNTQRQKRTRRKKSPVSWEDHFKCKPNKPMYAYVNLSCAEKPLPKGEIPRSVSDYEKLATQEIALVESPESEPVNGDADVSQQQTEEAKKETSV